MRKKFMDDLIVVLCSAQNCSEQVFDGSIYCSKHMKTEKRYEDVVLQENGSKSIKRALRRTYE